MTSYRYEWQEAYGAVQLELDPEQLKTKVASAENAIFRRLQELAGNSDHSEERSHITNAVRQIRKLQIERLQYPSAGETQQVQ